MTYCSHDDRHYLKRWTATVKERPREQIDDESTFLPQVESLYNELRLKYGVRLWNAIAEISSIGDLRRMSDIFTEGAGKRVSLLSIYKKIEEMEGLSLATPGANNVDRGVVTGPGRDASPSVSPDLFFRTG